MNQNDNRSQEVGQGDLDDLPGTYTIDDGHPGSYDHESVVSVGADASVTVACACGEWTRTGTARFGDEGDTAVLAEWENHVRTATGRPGWLKDGTVDIDAVRAGAHDVNDSAAVFESLCDEVEELRAAADLLRETAKALTVQLPARTVEAEREYLWTLARRASVVKESVAAALDPEDAADFDMAARNVRSQASLQIAMYQVREGGDVR
jgi:hypothetical protein